MRRGRSLSAWVLARKKHFRTGIARVRFSFLVLSIYLFSWGWLALPRQWNHREFCFAEARRGVSPQPQCRWASGGGEGGTPSRWDPASFSECFSAADWGDHRSLKDAGKAAGFEAFPLEHACPFLLPILWHGQRRQSAASSRHRSASSCARPRYLLLSPLGKSLDNLLFKWTSCTFAMVTYFSQWRILKRIVCKRSSAPYWCPSPLPSLPKKEKKPVKGAPRVWN